VTRSPVPPPGRGRRAGRDGPAVVAAVVAADDPGVPIGLVTAPRAGTFLPHVRPEAAAKGEPVHAGQALGVVTSSIVEEVVRSSIAGTLRAYLVLPGERVRPGQPLAWLTTSDAAERPSG
jgi:biotin carboxyl carrier protein